jgi:hypothetical protein
MGFAAAAAVLALALSAAPVAPVGLPGSGLTRLSGGSPFAHSCAARGVQRGSEVEPTIAAGAGGLVVAAWQQDRYVRSAAAGIGARVSRDGGATWFVPDVPGITQ